ncbi:MAG: hypothetical protein K0U74_07155 [Alphaproteobacteria bacterium]|nr:hypothetical protein [Alphaproteobacteria bacterium]
MPNERTWSTITSVAIMFAAGLFVTMTSLAALNAASVSASGSTCSQHGCISIASNF